MPELPEVHAKKRYFDEAALDQRIRDITITDGHIIKEISAEDFDQKLRGRQFVSSYRRGKYLFAKLDNGHHVLLHFGMSGKLHYYRAAEEQPKYERFRFNFDNGMKMGFDCPRKFARIRYIPDLEAYIKEKKLAPDALEFTKEQFLELFEGKTGTLKGLLLKQEYIAGIGNLYADEMCFQTGIHPASVSGKVPVKKQVELFEFMQQMFAFALEKNATYSEYPNNWLWKHRDEGKEAPGGGRLEKAKIAGRTSYFVPERQELFK